MQYNIAEFIGSIQDGGAETLVKDYALMLDKSKFNVVVIVLRRCPNTANDRILIKNGIKIIPICKSNFVLFKIIQRLNYWWYVPYRLQRIVKKEKLNVIHIHLSLLKYINRIRNKLKNIRLFYTCHSEPKLFLDGKRKAEGKAANKLLKYNNLQLIALHDDMRNEINNMFNIENTVVIRNGIDFKRFNNIKESREKIRKDLEIPENAFVMGHIGRFMVSKNHDFLIDVFAEVCKRKNSAFLLLIGAGELMDEVKVKINKLNLASRVLILSHRSDVPQLMRAMDIFVFPSLFEGLGTVLIEAQVSGLRCIVSDTVPKDAFQTELAVPMSLNDSPKKWCDVILDRSINGQANGNINDYNMNTEIKRLEKLYMGELHD